MGAELPEELCVTCAKVIPLLERARLLFPLGRQSVNLPAETVREANEEAGQILREINEALAVARKPLHPSL